MFNLPQEIQRYIYEFCSDKWENMNKVINQFLKGGFNRIHYNIKRFIKNEKKLAINAKNYKNSRKSEVTSWLRNIKKFENTHPEEANYLNKKELEIKIKIALKTRKEKEEEKLRISNERIRERKISTKCERELKKEFLTEYYYGQELRLPINVLIPSMTSSVSLREDETMDCDICTCKIVDVYCYNKSGSGFGIDEEYKKMRFNEKWVKQHIVLNVELRFNNGLRRYYNVSFFKQRIELSKHYGVEKTQNWKFTGEELELDIIEIKNCKYIYDEKGIYAGIKNLLLNTETQPIGIYDKKIDEIYFCEFE